MSREKFIENCVQMGYASRKIATYYAQKKTEFDEKDYEEVFKLDEATFFANSKDTWRVSE